MVDCYSSNILSVHQVRDMLYLQMSMNATKTHTHAKTTSYALTRLVRSTAYTRKDTGCQVKPVKVRNTLITVRVTNITSVTMSSFDNLNNTPICGTSGRHV